MKVRLDGFWTICGLARNARLVLVRVLPLLLSVCFGCAQHPAEGQNTRPQSEERSLSAGLEASVSPQPYAVSFVVSPVFPRPAQDAGLLLQPARSNPQPSFQPADGKATASSRFVRETGYLIGRMQGVSQLVQLASSAPDGAFGLELRCRRDLETAHKLLQSEGFFDGQADFILEGMGSGKARVVFTLYPGPRYTLGDLRVVYVPRPEVPGNLKAMAQELFPSRGIKGLQRGEEATAQHVLAAVSALPEPLHRHGYPDAKITEQHYFLDRDNRTLNAVIALQAGRPATLGPVQVSGQSSVDEKYINRLAGWEPGTEFWNSEKVNDYVTKLRRTGLFKSVKLVTESELESGLQGQADCRPVRVAVEDAPHRTVGGMIRYETDTGLGVEGNWEHRNLFGSGEKLALTAPMTVTERGLKAVFQKPEFLEHAQSLLMNGSAVREESEAYERSGIALSGGIERRMQSCWYLYGGLGADTGTIKNNLSSELGYSVYSAELKGRRDTRSDPLNPVSGTNVELAFKPLTGEYDGSFTALGSRMSLAGYWAPFQKDGQPDDGVVLAGRAEAGSFTGAPLRSIPPSQRYYLGGAGTVCGYGYQQIGPMDKENEPMGARSFQLVNLESRFRVSESLGFVTFLDGGMAYRDELPSLSTEMDWGAGAGIRYFTPIGPVRFDVAFPLKQSDPPLQFYISIGQAF